MKGNVCLLIRILKKKVENFGSLSNIELYLKHHTSSKGHTFESY